MTLSNLLTNLRELQISKSGIKIANKLTPISEIASFAEFESELLDFSENYISFDDSGIALKSILQKVYTAGTISGFDRVQIKNGAITGTFYENLTPTLSKRFSFTASPAGIYYELINADQLESAN